MTIQALDGQFSTITWPWPKLIITQHYVLVCALADFGLASGSVASGVTTLVLFECYNDATGWHADARVDLGPAGEVESVEVLDFNLFYVISTYGTDSLGQLKVQNWMRNPRTLVSTHAQLPTTNCPNFISGCNFNGQAVVGGIVNSDPSWEYANTETMLWSQIGNFNFRMVESKSAGNCQVDWGNYGHGRVLKMFKLGKGVLALGDGGWQGLDPQTVGVNTDVVIPTFGKVALDGIGISSPNHAIGNENGVFLINHKRELVVVSPDFKSQVMGYEEFLGPMTNIQMSYDSLKQRLFISDENKSYCFQHGGLFECHQRVTSCGAFRGKTLVGFFTDNQDYKLRIVTDTLDLKQRGIKTFESVEMSGVSITRPFLGVQYKATINAKTFNERLATTNDEGVAYPRVATSDARLVVQVSDYRNSDFSISNLKTRLKLTDFRNTRGLYDAS